MGRGDNKAASELNKQNAATGSAEIASATSGQNAAIGSFTNRLNSIFANNPYTDPTYLANIHSAASNVESGAQNSGNTKMEDYAARTGENSSNVLATEEEGARDSARREHGILTQQAIQDYGTRQNQLMQATSMLGSVPGMYGGQLGSGTSLATGGASGETQLAGQPSWFDSLLNAGISAAGTAAAGFCPVRGSLVLMADGSKVPVEDLVFGDMLRGADGGEEKMVTIPQPLLMDCCEVACQNGATVRCSTIHALVRAVPGYVTAYKSEGSLVLTEDGTHSIVERVKAIGKEMVYRLNLDRTHTYCAGGLWAFE